MKCDEVCDEIFVEDVMKFCHSIVVRVCWWSSISKLLRWRCDEVFDEVLYQNCCDEIFVEDVMKL